MKNTHFFRLVFIIALPIFLFVTCDDDNPKSKVEPSEDNGVSIEGTLTSKAGKPLEGAAVHQLGYPKEKVKSDSEGKFSLTVQKVSPKASPKVSPKASPKASPKLVVNNDKDISIVISYDQGESLGLRIDGLSSTKSAQLGSIAVSPTGQIKGQVINPWGEADKLVMEVIGTKYQDETDENGVYILDKIPEGVWDLYLEKEDYYPLYLQGIKVTPGQITVLPAEVLQPLETPIKTNNNNNNEEPEEIVQPEPIALVNCLAHQEMGESKSGMYKIAPEQNNNNSFEVFCDLENDGGGWTLLINAPSGGIPNEVETLNNNNTGRLSWQRVSLLHKVSKVTEKNNLKIHVNEEVVSMNTGGNYKMGYFVVAPDANGLCSEFLDGPFEGVYTEGSEWAWKNGNNGGWTGYLDHPERGFMISRASNGDNTCGEAYPTNATNPKLLPGSLWIR